MLRREVIAHYFEKRAICTSILDFKHSPWSECCMLSSGKSPAPELYMLTFRNTLFHVHKQVVMKYT